MALLDQAATSHLSPRQQALVRLRGFDSNVLARWLCLLPAFLTLLVWVYWPLAESFRLSFYEWNMLPTVAPEWVGFDNYLRLLQLPEMKKAAWNTVLYTFGLIPLTVGLPLVVALAARGVGERAGAIYRALIFIPMIIAPVVVAIVWRWLLSPDHGIINEVITSLGFSPIRFLQDRNTALWAILFITGWKLLGFSTLVIAAAMTSIDPALFEAARLEGASASKVALHIIIPLISPVLLLLTMLTMLHGAQWSFVYINVLTHGGPLQSTTNLYFLLYDYGFSNFAVGWSTAAGMISFAIYGIIALVCLRLMKRYAIYES